MIANTGDEIVVWQDGRAPIRVRIGVSGHRRLENPEMLAAAIRRAMTMIRERVSPVGTTPVAFTAVSSLAEGADRLVALTVLEEPGADLEVPLPLAPEEYEKDFESDDSRREFRNLLDLAARSEVVSVADRPQAYLDAGKAVLRQVDVLLAVWDGQASRGSGGTAEIVTLALHEPLPTILIDAGTGEVKDHLGPNVVPPKIVAELDAYNRPGLSSPTFDQDRQKERSYLVSPDALRADPELGLLVDWMLPFYMRADALAKDQQKKFFRLGAYVFRLAAFAVTVAAAQAIFFPHLGALAWAEVGLLLIGYRLVVHGEHHKVIKRWLWYRSLAERLRSTFYLAAAGIREPREPVGPSDSDEQWILLASVGVWSSTGRPTVHVTDEAVASRREFLAECWIQGQIRYHEDAKCRHADANESFKTNIKRLFLLIVVLAALHGILALLADRLIPVDVEEPMARWLSFLTIVLPAWGAAQTGIEELKEHRRYSDRSTQVGGSLSEMMGSLSKVTTPDELANLALQVDAIVREDTIDWFGIMSVHEIPPPAG